MSMPKMCVLCRVYTRATCCAQQAARNTQLVAQLVARNKHQVARNLFRATCCAGVNAALESKVHFGLPWLRPWDYRGKCYMEGKRIQCLSNASQHAYPSIFNRFPVIQPKSPKVRHFSTFFAHFGLPGYAPAGQTLVKRLAACTHLSSTISEI